MLVAFRQFNSAALNVFHIWFDLIGLNWTEWHMFYWHSTKGTQHMKFIDSSAAERSHGQRQNVNLPIHKRWISIYGTKIRIYVGIVNVLILAKIGFNECLNHFMCFFPFAKHSMWNGITVEYHWDNGRICALCYLIKISKNHWNIKWNCSKRDLVLFLQFSWSAFWLNC